MSDDDTSMNASRPIEKQISNDSCDINTTSKFAHPSPMASIIRTRRSEASGPGWQEHFVDFEQASFADSVGSSISDSYSYVTIPDFSTAEECCVLRDSALRLSQDTTISQRTHVLAASRVNMNCTRYSVEALLDSPAKAVNATFLTRLLVLLERDKDLHGVFDKSNLPSHTAKWYSEPDGSGSLIPEPKVNIYKEGGYFKEHTDGMHLTLLVTLNDAFEGGGTAFFCQ